MNSRSFRWFMAMLILGIVVSGLFLAMSWIEESARAGTSPADPDVQCVTVSVDGFKDWDVCDMPDGARCVYGGVSGMFSCYMPAGEGLSK